MKAVWKAFAGAASGEWEQDASRASTKRAERAAESQKKSDSFNRRVMDAMTIASASSESIATCQKETIAASPARSVAAKIEKNQKWLNLFTSAWSLRMLYRFVLQVSSRSARFRRGLFRGASRRRPKLGDCACASFLFSRAPPASPVDLRPRRPICPVRRDRAGRHARDRWRPAPRRRAAPNCHPQSKPTGTARYSQTFPATSR